MHRHASMNRLYRLVWSHVQRAWVAVAENTRSQGKGARRTLLLAATLTCAQVAQAGPSGEIVTNGSATIARDGIRTTVTQGSAQLSMNWTNFNTSLTETIEFIQPSSSAIAVNRILDASSTTFNGQLLSNGQVYLINPNGILFGTSARVNVGGLVASTLDIDDSALTGNTRQFRLRDSAPGSIVNASPQLYGGYVALLGKTVRNHGTITANDVALGAGSDITLAFAGNRLLAMQVNQSTLETLTENTGTIIANGGAVLLSAGARDAVLANVVNNTGIIEAHSAFESNGRIVLEGGGNSKVINSGALVASSTATGRAGGSVKVLGDQVTLSASSLIDVSGTAGGGGVLVGGSALGQGLERQSSSTTVHAGSIIRADATRTGNGGQIVVTSNGETQFNGALSAQGGATRGNGGTLETSGTRLQVSATASATTAAASGHTGSWLLDQREVYDLTVGAAGNVNDNVITAALRG